MYALNNRETLKRVLFCHKIIKFSAYFTRAIVNKLFGSNHNIFLLTVKTHKQILGKRGSSVDQSTNLELGHQ